jgi:1-acyl-sn-glycerol-3-phosphate acyltransferase
MRCCSWCERSTSSCISVEPLNSYVDALFLAALLPKSHCFVASFSWQKLPLLHRYFSTLGMVFFRYSGQRDSPADL